MFRFFEYFITIYKEPEIINIKCAQEKIDSLLLTIDQVMESLKEKVE